jgi:hypothetical protein
MGMDRERRGTDQHLPLRRVEFHILLSLAAGERHGYGIIPDIEGRGETAVPDVGTMYRALARMVENRLIEAAPVRRVRIWRCFWGHWTMSSARPGIRVRSAPARLRRWRPSITRRRLTEGPAIP